MELLGLPIDAWVGIFSLLTIIGGWFGVRGWARRKLAQWNRVFEGLRKIPDMQGQLSRIAYYVSPNGGGSLVDASQRIELGIKDLNTRVAVQEGVQSILLDDNPLIATFQASSDGQYLTVNRTYARWLCVERDDLEGWKYLSYIHEEDVEAVREEWALARAEHRLYRQSYRVKTASGKVIHVEANASPIPDSPPAARWLGHIRKVDAPAK